MKTIQTRRLPLRRELDGFTLIELLIVISIIALLAAITVGSFTYAQVASGRNRTLVNMAAIKGGLEQYKEKWGEYPEPANEMETVEFAGVKLTTGPAAMLYQALTGDGTDAIKTATAGGNPSDGQITVEEAANGVASDLPKSIILRTGNTLLLSDGFSHPFQYKKAATGTETAVTVNPTYDLWSYAQGKTSGEMDNSLRAKAPAFWIKNW